MEHFFVIVFNELLGEMFCQGFIGKKQEKNYRKKRKKITSLSHPFGSLNNSIKYRREDGNITRCMTG